MGSQVSNELKMKTIEDLRKDAESTLCECCFQKYKMLIEPTIRDWLSKPLGDWSEAELQVTWMVMKKEGVFKGNEVDETAYDKIETRSFKCKIDYLHKNGILGDSSYRLLDIARKVRNRIHNPYTPISEQDRTLFYIANVVTSKIYNATMFDLEERISTNLKSEAEKCAEQCLLKMNYK